MRKASRRLLCAAVAALLLLPLWGCDLRQIHLLIADFESSDVGGVVVWRVASGTQELEVAGRLLFSEPYRQSGHEVIDYTQVRPSGEEGITLQAIVARDPRQPDLVELRVYYERVAPAGWFRVSTFNQLGISEPSLEKTYL